ncbi:PH domain-containing protein [Rhodococcus qingshengii]|uniref:PH domain-containing protein n=1 Tax=Rhodococcus qingshengii TaxID=334542 RepID=UPI0036D8D0C2
MRADEEWCRPARGTIGFAAVLSAGAAIGTGLPAALALNRESGLITAVTWILPSAIVVVLLGTFLGAVYGRTFRFRITDELVETRFELVLCFQRTLRRDRIRTVDVTANPILRVLGLAELTAGTGQSDGESDRVRLVPLRRVDAEDLRRMLLSRNAVPDGPTGITAADEEQEELICALDWRWARFAPTSAVTAAVSAAGIIAMVRVADWGGVDLSDARRVMVSLGVNGLLIAVPALLVAGTLLGMLGAVVVFVEQWKGYSLTRDRDGELLMVTRGALTTRAISVDERKLNGLTLLEPLGGRRFGATRVDAVAAGIRETDRDRATRFRTLLPAAPRCVAERVAAEVLRLPSSPTDSVVLQVHPRAARTKRTRRAAAAIAVLLFFAGSIGLQLGIVAGALAVSIALVVAPIVAAIAQDAYRNLGNGTDAQFVVARSGIWSRRTTALRRDDLLVWQLSRSPLQWRTGLATASTFAAGGVCCVRDVSVDRGVQLIAETSQGLLDQFLTAAAPPDQ